MDVKKLQDGLRKMSREQHMAILKNLFQVSPFDFNSNKEYEHEGQLKKMFLCLVEEDPLGYLETLISVDNFQVSDDTANNNIITV